MFYENTHSIADFALEMSTIRCQAKFMSCEISDFMPCEHAQIAQSNILHITYAKKIDDWALGFRVSTL